MGQGGVDPHNYAPTLPPSPQDAHHAVLERASTKSEWKRRMGRSTGWCTHSSYFSPR